MRALEALHAVLIGLELMVLEERLEILEEFRGICRALLGLFPRKPRLPRHRLVRVVFLCLALRPALCLPLCPRLVVWVRPQPTRELRGFLVALRRFRRFHRLFDLQKRKIDPRHITGLQPGLSPSIPLRSAEMVVFSVAARGMGPREVDESPKPRHRREMYSRGLPCTALDKHRTTGNDSPEEPPTRPEE